MATIEIGVTGDFNPANPTHLATNTGIAHSAQALGHTVNVTWLPTGQPHHFAAYQALIASPGSPYRSLDGALAAIRFAREHDVPFLGTCGGFQHAILEFARNVLGIGDASHEETDPEASVLFLTRLTCSLAGKTMRVEIEDGTAAAAAYGEPTAEERYYCNFGLNPAYRNTLTEGGLRISGTDQDGEVRIVELPACRFFVGTLFVPQARSTPDRPHPLVNALCRAAARL